ncbi:BamA/TamA family outer membrane protein [Thiohalomonas denitrificans]|uniref:Surface antigen variable number repeat-containing protein n=1 Tax=Thiohalomonas denitrificans TaxID=415747 RepID=A0A1G5PTA2_9GAMM|nr:BamA/TamA family outer membrane protein [Thiohalomonas denitrificans]SCZ52476.1 Surface antigen variable number repeat-containing protein [Thiohalomonas denitrificans]
MRVGSWLLLLMLLSSAVDASERITDIRFEGNRVTKDRILLQEMTVAVGETADSEAIENSRQAIMNLGLFEWVRWELTDVAEGQLLTISVKEKYYVLPLPRLDGDPDGSYSYGAELRLDNIGGVNQRLKVTLDTSDHVNDEDALKRELSADYSYPRIEGTFYNLDADFKIERTDFDVTEDSTEARYQREYRRIGVGISRWLDTLGPSRGWRIGGGLTLEQRDFSRLSGASLLEDDQAVTLNGSILFDALQDHGYYRSGGVTGYETNIGLKELGSDDFYNRHTVFYRRYHAYGDGHNLNWQLRFGMANGRKFGALAYHIGGADTLRGYDSLDGNAMVLANIEYLKPVWRRLRAVLFADIGNVYPDVLDTDLTELRVGAGFGLRWDVTWFVDLSLRVDVAYGFDAGEVEAYGGTSRTF